jgi:hypothetical protein
MGLNVGCKEQSAKLLQYQPKTYHWSIRQSKKSSQRLQENASLLQWHVWGKPPNQKGSGGELVFRPRTGRNEPVSPIGVVIVKFAHATCTGFWKEWKSGREGGDFWDGHYRPFCRLSTCCWERGSCFAVSRWLRPWDRGHPERPVGRPQPSRWLRPFHGRQLLLSLSWMAEDRTKTLQGKGHCQVILLEGDVV